MTANEQRQFERGAWFAFDAVLGWINTQEEKFIDKHHLYKAVMNMRPWHIQNYIENSQRETHE